MYASFIRMIIGCLILLTSWNVHGAGSDDDSDYSVNSHSSQKARKPVARAAPKAELVCCDDSDTEDAAPVPQRILLEPLEKLGGKAKLLANVFLKQVSHRANVWWPQYKMTYQNQAGTQETKTDFFRWGPHRAICIFASGGFQNAWEKVVAHVYKVFFGMHIKIIRAGWTDKHRDKTNTAPLLRDEYEDRPEDLHSELFYDRFFREHFLPKLPLPAGATLTNLTINAFSWWNVCDTCHTSRLSTHQRVLNASHPQATLTYNIGFARHYSTHHASVSHIQCARIPQVDQLEQTSWDAVWAHIKRITQKHFTNETNEQAKEQFWTNTREGIELTKWFGQAFYVDEKPGKKGHVLKFFQALPDTERQGFESLVAYLRDKNWEFSCWYSHPADTIQGSWNQHWRQMVMPHFGWKEVHSDKAIQATDCEMCGKEDLLNFVQAEHTKYRAAKTNKFREHTLVVGKKCFSVLSWERATMQANREIMQTDLDIWQGREDRERLEQAQVDSLEQADELLEAFAEAKKAQRKPPTPKKSSAKRHHRRDHYSDND